MKETDFIRVYLNKWNRNFPNLHIRYAYEENSNFHIIEISPESLLIEDQKFRTEVHNFWNDFSDRFPSSDLLVSEPYDSYNMSNLLYDNRDNYKLLVQDFKDSIRYNSHIVKYTMRGTKCYQQLVGDIDDFSLAA